MLIFLLDQDKHGKQLKRTKVKLDLLTDINMLLIVEKGTRRGIWHANYQYVKDNNKYKKDYDKNKESSFLKYFDEINLFGWAMSQKFPALNGLKIFLNLRKAL